MGTRRIHFLFLAMGLILTPHAGAHGDRPLSDGEVALAPGASVTFVQELHYHRLVGNVRALDDAGASIGVSVRGPDGSVRTLAEGASSHELLALIACCDDQVWAEHTFFVRNDGFDPVEVTVELVLLHDNLYIFVHDREPGAGWQTALIVTLIAAVPAMMARRPDTPDDALAAKHLQRAWTAFGIAWVGALLLAAVGMVLHGGGPAVATLAATSIAPGGGGFFNTHAIMMLALMGAWLFAHIGWAKAARHAPDPRASGTHRLAYALAASTMVVAVTLMLELGATMWVWLAGVLPTVFVLFATQGPSGPGEPSAA